MAIYDEPQWATKRLRYFDGQFLQSQDFIDESMFHIATAHRDARLLQSAGVAEGLDVVPSAAPSQVVVKAGTAIDPNGRQILLSADQPVTLTGQTGNLSLYIEFHEDASDDVAPQAGGVEDFTRFTQTPTLAFTVAPAPIPADAVLLAIVPMTSAGVVGKIDQTTRAYAGVRLPATSGQSAPSLSASGDGLTGWADFSASLRLKTGAINCNGLTVTNTALAKGGLNMNGRLHTGGNPIYFAADPNNFADTSSVIQYDAVNNGLAIIGAAGVRLGTTTALSSGGTVALTVTGSAVAVTGGFSINGNPLQLRSAVDTGNAIAWDSAFGGVSVLGSAGVRLGASAGSAPNWALTVGNQAVTVNGTFQVFGPVGLGTTSAPLGMLDIQGGADAIGTNDQCDIALQWRSGGYRHHISSRHNSGAPIGNAIDFYVWNSAVDPVNGLGTKQVMTLDGTGAVGITTTSPNATLSLGATFANNKLYLYDAGNEKYGLGATNGSLLLYSGNNTNNKFLFGTFDGNTFRESMRVLNTGMLGLGTTTPLARLHVHGNSSAGNNLGQNLFEYGFVAFEDNTNNGLSIGFDPGNACAWLASRQAGAQAKPLYLNLNASMMVAPQGGVGIGITNRTTLAQASLSLPYGQGTMANAIMIGDQANNSGGHVAQVLILCPADAGKHSSPIEVVDPSGDMFLVANNGDLFYRGNSSRFSDARLKQNIRTLDGALDKVARLRGASFEWLRDGRSDIGLVAQEVEQVLPEVVTESAAGIKAVDYSALAPVLIEAIKELKNIVESQRGE